MQWFVDVKPLAEQAIAAVNDGKTKIIPSNWSKTYFEWMNNIRDWCISRQIWWGHRIPAWYCSQCAKITVEMEDPTYCSHCGSADIEQETDVLDTWFSSALWPFTTLGWPEKTEELKSFYPTSCLVTGFDILFFWVARMMMMGSKFMGDVPFKDVYIHALVRDAHGHKMSKSKGNVIDPLVIIDKFGADSFRFTLTAMAAQGRDISLSEERIEGYRHFVNKIWNASRFTLMNLDGYEEGAANENDYDLKDRWILSRLNTIIDTVDKTLDEYRFNETANQLYQFVWHEFCDWYVEMAKNDLYQKEDSKRRRTTQKVMVRTLRTVLELLHPMMPFVTEEIWQKIPHEGESIVIADFPETKTNEIDKEAENDMNEIIQVVSAVRNIRSEMSILPSARPSCDFLCQEDMVEKILKDQTKLLCSLAGLSEAKVHKEFKGTDKSATAVVDKVEIFLSLEGVIDFGEEKKRLQKDFDKINKDIDFISKKLSNESFVSRAPKDIVDKERAKLIGFKDKASKISENIARIG
jgi:valyl-tRNA synthetase